MSEHIHVWKEEMAGTGMVLSTCAAPGCGARQVILSPALSIPSWQLFDAFHAGIARVLVPLPAWRARLVRWLAPIPAELPLPPSPRVVPIERDSD